MILEIILIVFILFISYMLVLAMRRINQYEDFILQIQQIVTFATDKMKQVDSTGHFEADDEVGFFFEEVKSLQNLLNEVFEIQEENNDGNK